MFPQWLRLPVALHSADSTTVPSFSLKTGGFYSLSVLALFYAVDLVPGKTFSEKLWKKKRKRRICVNFIIEFKNFKKFLEIKEFSLKSLKNLEFLKFFKFFEES